MTKEELSSLKKIKREIEQIKDELRSIKPEYTKDSVTGSDACHPYTQHQIKIEGYDFDSYDRKFERIKKRLNRKLDEIIDQKDKITEYIYNNVEDSELRQILKYKYIDCMKSKEIGDCMGWTSRTIERRLEKWDKSCRWMSAKKKVQ